MKSKVRVGHFSPDAPAVDVAVDGKKAFENIKFRKVTDWADLGKGSYTISVMPHGKSSTVLKKEVELKDNMHYTILATGLMDKKDLKLHIIDDKM